MLRQIRLLLGISVFWLALSILLDGVTTLVLPLQISKVSSREMQATMLGLLTLVGLLMGALVQPIAGALSDRWRPVLGRKGFIGIGLLLNLLSLFLFSFFDNLAGIMIGYLFIQISASLAQAGQQGLIPDLIDRERRGVASGLKGFMDMTGAMLGFVLLGQLLGADKTPLALGVIAAILVSAYLLAVLLTPEDKADLGKKPLQKTVSVAGLFRLDLQEQTAFRQVLIARFLFLFGIYAIGRFLVLFVANRLGLDPNEAAEQAGMLLAGLAFVTILASPITGWLADRAGRIPLMFAGAILSAMGTLLLIWADSMDEIFLFGGLMSLGSAAFSSGSWALVADLVPKNQPAHYFGLANFSIAGPAALVGLLGPAIDSVEAMAPGSGYTLLFIVAATAFLASILPIRNWSWKETNYPGVKNGNKRKDRPDAPGLAVIHIPADPATVEEDQDPPRGSTQL